MRSSLGIAAGTVALAIALPAGASAATFAVDRLDDPPGAGACSPAPNDCSLSQAAEKADVDSAADLISLGPGEHLLAGEIGFEEPVTVIGAGARQTIVRRLGNGPFLNFSQGPGATSELADLTVTGGRNQGNSYGGAIRSDTALVVRRVAIVDNVDGGHSATPGLYPAFGGAVYSLGEMTIVDSLIAHNRATVEDNGNSALGGGLYLVGQNNVIRNSTIAENVAEGSASTAARGGGILLGNGRSLTLENVTLVGNTAIGDPTSQGTNLAIGPGATATVRDSIFARGLPAAVGSCDRPVVSGGGNVDDASECGFTTADRRGVDPLLGPLADNGGPTDTFALGAGSPALDFGGACGLEADQRGLPRPPGLCDAGAFEDQAGRPAAACTLKVSGTAAGLRARIKCDLAASLSIGGGATIKPRKKGKKPKHVVLRPVTAAAAAGTTVTVTVRLQKGLRRAVNAGRRVSAVLTLTARTAGGVESEQTAKVSKIKKPPRKKRHAGR